MSSIADRVRAVVADSLGEDAETLKPATTFESLGADSLDRMEITLALEQEFGITIPDADGAAIHTVGAAAEYIMQRTEAV